MGKIGYKHTEEAKKKISEAGKGRIVPKYLPERLKKMSEYNKLHGVVPPNRKGATMPMEARIRISEALKGNKGSGWKGGITPLNKLIRGSLEYRLWRESVFKRDDYTCIWCGIRSGNGKAIILHADHIKPFAHYPELRFAIDNGRTLCIDCHKKTETYARR
jgi:hypothetical protein